jgi:hypothetical protein
MNEPPIDPIDPQIADLLARERKGYVLDPALKQAVLAKVDFVVALRGVNVKPPVAAKGRRRGLATKILLSAHAAIAIAFAAFTAGAVGGGFVMRSALHPPAPPAVTVTPPAPPAVQRPAEATAASRDTAAPSATASPPAIPSVAPTPSAVASPSASATGDLTREREVLDIAHAALERGRPSDALAAANRHAREWPRGYLGEEREAVIIQALAASGNGTEATSRLERFRTRFPKSMLIPALEAVTGNREKK